MQWRKRTIYGVYSKTKVSLCLWYDWEEHEDHEAEFMSDISNLTFIKDGQ